MKIVHCRVNHLKNPLGYALDKPSFSWQVENAAGKAQAAARLVVARDAEFEKVIYDSGFAALDPLGTVPDLGTLEPRTRYYWQVSVKTDAGEQAVSEPQWFETAKQGEPWAGQWIGCDDAEPHHPIFSKALPLAGKVQSARLYICGLGLYEAYIDGERVGEEYLTPYCTAYDKWLQYQTFDVTAALQNGGAPKLSVLLGNGWYMGRFGFRRAHNQKPYYGDAWALMAELRVQYSDGSEGVFATDESWEVGRSDITFSNIYDGEQANATLPSLPVCPARLLTPETGAPKAELCARRSTPVTVHEQLPAKELLHTPAGETVLDIGQNLAGSFRLWVEVPVGETVRLQFGELLQNGNFYNGNLRTAKAEYVWISDGIPQFIQPHFTYYGYRYVKVEGVPGLKAEDFTALALYSEIEPIGDIETGDPLVNRLIQNVQWGQKSNFLDVPTDCPQRDERMGWTGDTQVFAPTACYLTDCTAFFEKYLTDISAEQQARGGQVPNVIPAFGYNESAAAWGDVACILPWTLYEFTGDKQVLARNFAGMAAWVGYVQRQYDAGSWLTQFHFGDWLALDGPDPDGSDATRGGTDEGFVAAAYFYRSAILTARAAAVLEDTEASEKYTALAARILVDIQREYYSPNGRCCIDTQTAHLLTLAFGLHPDRARAAEALQRKLKWSKGKLQTGFVGTPFLCETLSAIGDSKAAYKLLLNEELPGWLYAVKMGATTVWERWNSVLPNGQISPTGMNSLNHYAYGSVLAWLWRWGAGLQPAAPGFAKANLCPQPNWALRHLQASYRSAAGLWQVGWQCVDAEHLKIEITVPFNCETALTLPLAPESAYTHGHTLTAGHYVFAYQTTAPLRTVYSTALPITTLLDNPKTRATLQKLMPQVTQLPESMRGLTFRQAAARFGMPDATLGKLNAMLAEIED